MSFVFTNTKKLYKKSFISTFFCFLISCIVLYFFHIEQLIPFVFGALIAILPQLIFIGYVLYFKGNQPVNSKAKGLYQGEGLKLISTIGLFILAFSYFEINPIGLFSGYFLFLILNNLLPVFFNVKSTN